MAASTALVTFLFQSPRHATRVDILGSWDNFAKAYPMQRDSIVSSTSWKGCHSFSGIVCDGDVVAMGESTRDGALLMGGTYWYYVWHCILLHRHANVPKYRLDDDVECHDPMTTSTRGCPFLPGQEVNVLDVPTQKDGCLTVGAATLLLSTFTIDPAARFTSPKRQLSPVGNAIEQIKGQDLAIATPVRRTSSLRNSLFSNLPKFSLARSRTMLNRQTRSAVSTSRTTIPLEQIRPFSENDAAVFAGDWSSEIHSLLGSPSADQKSKSPPLQPEPDDQHDLVLFPSDNACLDTNSLDFDLCGSVSRISTAVTQATNELEDCGWPCRTEERTFAPVEVEHPASMSDRTSGFFSLLSGSIGSPVATNCHFNLPARPQTPSLDFDGFTLEPFRLDFSSLDKAVVEEDVPDYADPKECSALSLKLQPQAIASFKDLNHTVKLSPLEKLDMVESWRHGESPSTVTEHEPSALQEFIKDLGYLSALID